ncbi:MAG: response regulator [Oceanospirillaceae bacterium]|nr:response regulator [Oceanospirillaceae bacterium]MCP5336046.1 response regulator [Oceanospirillaceae bacterium]MCP5350294.1 response regulator [Oceanospirillaceae bacterium]
MLLRCLLVLCACCCLPAWAVPQLNISPEQIAAGAVRLDSRWAMDFAELHTDFAREVNETQSVPGLWHQDGQHPRQGYATLRLQLNMPARQAWYLYVPDMPSAMALYVNGELYYQRGQVADNAAAEKPHYGPTVLNLPVAEHYQLLLQISNYHHKDGGIWHSLRIADRAHLAALQNQNQLLDVLLFAVLASLGIYHLGLWYLRRQEQVALYFGLFSLSVALRSLIVGERVAYLWPLPLNWENLQRLEHILLYLAIPFFARYFACLYPRYVQRALLLLTGWGCAALVSLTLLTPAVFFTHLGAVAQVWILLLSLYVISVGLRAWQHNAHFSRLFLASFALLFITVLNDFLYTHLLLQTRPLVQLGVIAFVIMQAALLNRRYVQSLNAVEHMHENLQEKNRALKQLHEFKDILLANTSHELRTPIHGMLGLSGELLKNTRDPQQQALITRLQESAQHMNRLISDLLDQEKSPELQRRVIALAPLLQQARALLSPLLENGVSLQLQVDEKLSVYADEQRLQQVLINLLGNAIKFTHQGHIVLRARAEGENVLIEIHDNGPGIDEHDWPRLLQRYQQGKTSSASAFANQGLGLSISQDILLKHASRLQLLPSEKGSRIGFYLPREAHSQQRVVIDSAPCGNSEGNKLLIIDDDSNNLALVRQQLSHLYHMRLCGDVGIGLQILQQWRPDCVLLDVMLQERSGLDVLQQIRQLYPQQQLPVLMFTASHRQQHLIQALRQGANDYLHKPCSAEELIARIENQLNLKRLWQQNRRQQPAQTSQSSADNSEENLRELGVKLARQCLNLWERYTGKSKADLAESSKIWRVYIDGSTVKTRTLDKYLALSTLPKQPRWRSVLRTAAFVQEHCQLSEQDAQALQQLAAHVDARLSVETE